jgi:hypothetical protein
MPQVARLSPGYLLQYMRLQYDFVLTKLKELLLNSKV